MKDEIYKKVYIKTEADLPKEYGEYITHDKLLRRIIKQYRFYEPDKEHWLKYVDWYLLPIEQSEPVTVSDEEIEKWVESSKEEQAKYDNGIVTTEQRTEVLLNQSMSCHPSREENLQVREAIRFLAKQIDIIHKLRILAKKGGKE